MLLSLMNIMLTLSCLISTQRREPYLGDVLYYRGKRIDTDLRLGMFVIHVAACVCVCLGNHGLVEVLAQGPQP